ncbi:unnamed protein product [Phytophthora fragariaefolia]|uniref:Unnamed protein product n=1 Tax=Phytophthora fragariaefolia TaxID=1490495 RepID=A0A9W6U9V2_9STRA|nr:unnamed protein product [Phytophthora fragariaefolia]
MTRRAAEQNAGLYGRTEAKCEQTGEDRRSEEVDVEVLQTAAEVRTKDVELDCATGSWTAPAPATPAPPTTVATTGPASSAAPTPAVSAASDSEDSAAGMANLASAINVMLATVSRLEARVAGMETARVATGSARAVAKEEDEPMSVATRASPGMVDSETTTERTPEPTRRQAVSAARRQASSQPSSPGDSSGDSSSDSSNEGDSDGSDGRQRHGRRLSVSTWIAKVDLAVEGVSVSGRGEWADKELYFIVGNKLQDNAAIWWVQMDQELPDPEKTWTRLKSALMRRYGELPDQAMAE